MLRSFLRPEVDGKVEPAGNAGAHSHCSKTERAPPCATDAESHRFNDAEEGEENAAFSADDAHNQHAAAAAAADNTKKPSLPVSSTYKESSLLFPTANPFTFEPKVQVPYAYKRGRMPRDVEIERRRRLYDSQNVNHLLEVSGLTWGLLARRSARSLPLEIFDDTTYDCRNPSEWMAMAASAATPAARFLPAEGVFHREDTDTFELRPCRVVGWAEDTNTLQLHWGATDEDSLFSAADAHPAAASAVSTTAAVPLPRIFVRFMAEDPVLYVQRLIHAHTQRHKATSWIIYRLCCDSMPVTNLEELDAGLAERLRYLGTDIPQLSSAAFPEVADRVERLVSEITLEWKRSHNRLLLHDRITKDPSVGRMVSNSTHMDPEELQQGPNVAVDRSELGDPATVIAVEDDNFCFADREEAFTFGTYFTQPEVVQALTGVRRECMKVLEGSLFDLPKERQLPLAVFAQRQKDHLARTSRHLKEEWMPHMCETIVASFQSAGKGWLNIREAKQNIYEMSKLKKFFTTVRFMMEDTLFQLVYNSLQSFTDFFEEVTDFTVTVEDMNNVKNAWPGSDADDCVEKQPLFTIDLVEADGHFSYSISFADFEGAIVELFNAAIVCTESVPQVERYVMTQYFWSRDGDGPFLDSVKKEEEHVCALRERVQTAVRNSLVPLQTYLNTYDELLPLIRLDQAQFVKEYAEAGHSMEEMKEEIAQHLRAKKSLAGRLPLFLTVGNFVVDCQSFSYLMSMKEEELAKLVMRLIGKTGKDEAVYVRNEFTRLLQTIEKTPQSPEKLFELLSFMDTIGDQVTDLTEHIAEVRQCYTILDGFQFELTDDESRLKWEAIGWPRQLALRSHAVRKQLEQVHEELHSGLQKRQEEFSKRVEQLQRVVATFSKHTDAAEADKVAAEVKTHNIEIRQCIEEARALNGDQRLFGDKLSDYRNVFELDKEFKPYSDLWLTTYTWQESYRRWHTDAFTTLDAAEIEATVASASKTMATLSRTFKDKDAMLRIVEGVKSSVEQFKPWVPILSSLRHHGMKERHWTGLSEKLGMALVPGDTLMVLEDCAPLLAHHEAVIRYCEVAAKESQIETALKEMRAKWESKSFIIEQYKETGTYILKDTSDVVELLDEHLNLTQQLQFSPFKAYFEEAITDWERSLNLISDTLEQWLECQRAWRYLEPILNSEDIAMQLPRLSALFEKVDRTWRRIMGNAHSQPNVLEYCIGTSKLLDHLREANRLLEEVQRGLNDYLADKRQTFPRFYFLSDEELLEILSQAKEVRRIDANISKLFENIQRLQWNNVGPVKDTADSGNSSTNSTAVAMAEEAAGAKKGGGEPEGTAVAASAAVDGAVDTITGFYSVEGEYIAAVTPVVPLGNVEDWLKLVEKMMKDSVHAQVKEAVDAYLSTRRSEWVLQWPAQAVIAVAQVYWTHGCEEALATKGTVDDFAKVLDKQLRQLVEVVQSPLTAVQQINMGALITIEVHAKDTVDNMQADKVSNIQSFEWIKQLRFYFEQSDNLCHIRQVDASFVYGGEYLGNTARLVVTPLTDRIYLTLTGALALCLGGAPAGPAGTGKTETTKDLAKALAKQCVVFNCQEGMTYLSMGKFFKGLAWTGAWACFDEFNRIDVEVLSVVAQQVTDLQQACSTKQYRILFEESDIVVDPTHAVFITMNPGYAGRTELPDNLKVLFRPVACMVPDYAMIGEIRLFSYGYLKARALAQKMVMTFKLSSEQLSSQDHYDFGMRAVNTVISAAGLNKRECPDGDEDELLLRALRDSNVPKFLKDDTLLFEGIISDLFPGIALPSSDYGVMTQALATVITGAQQQAVPAFVHKCLQLYDITTLRHGLMLVGPAGSGKTTAFTALQRALSDCAARQSKGENVGGRSFQKVYTHICNPKSVTMDQLYGAYDENGEWKDGVLCVLFRCAARYGDEGNMIGKHWVMFDGPVDALWIESMNTVLDENKKLCLVSGEIIQMNRDMTMMFEVEDLAVASPATVSRCGMIYLDPATCVPISALIASWAASLPAYMDTQREQLSQLASLYVAELVEFVRGGAVREYVASNTSGLVRAFFRMMDGYVKSLEKAASGPEQAGFLGEVVLPLFFFSLVWSVGATCDEEGRQLFAAKLREMAAVNGHVAYLPAVEEDDGSNRNSSSSGFLYDYCYRYDINAGTAGDEGAAAEIGGGGDGKTNGAAAAAPAGRWVHWMQDTPIFNIPTGTRFDDILVPTIDSTRQNYILHHLMSSKVNVAAVGPTGTGKSIALARLVLGGGMPSSFLGLNFTFSAQTKCTVLQASMMAKFDKRRSHVYGAPVGKHFLIFIDDANLPQPEKFGAQPPLELLRQMLAQGGFYTFTGGIKWSSIIDCSLALAMGPPGGGRSRISNRLMRYFNYLAFPEMSDVSKRTILHAILSGMLMQRGLMEEFSAVSSSMVDSTLRVFTKCIQTYLPTPAHVHYSFNMRDVMRVFPMLYAADKSVLQSETSFVRLWMHETQRVFYDRLINDSDKSQFIEFLDEELETMGVDGTYPEIVAADRLIFGDMLSSKDVYEQITDMHTLTTGMNGFLETYNEENEAKMNLVLFLDAIEHVCRICRVLKQPNGHCLLLGVGGSGRKSLTRLACSLIPEMEIFTIELTKNYGVKDWHESLAKLLLECGKDEKKCTFLFSDTQLVHPIFLEDVAGLLTSGDVPNLFEDQDLELINDKFRGVCISENLPTTKVSVYARFVKEARANLHLVLAFSPIGEAFRNRLRMFPALIACCTIDWFAEWPSEALLSVATAQLTAVDATTTSSSNNTRGGGQEEEEINSETAAALADSFQGVHLLAAEVTERFFTETRRRSYVTPTSYLTLLSNFKLMVAAKRRFIHEQRGRLEKGLEKLRETEAQVAGLEAQLKAQQPVLEAKKVEIQAMMERLTVDRKDAAVTETAARKEEAEASTKAEECAAMRRECADRLAEAEPALIEAVKVLSKIKAAEISELNKYTNPPKGVQYVMEAVALLLTFGNCPKEFYTGPPGGRKVPDWWLCAKSYMKDANRLLDVLVQPPEKGGFNRDAMDMALMDKVRVYYDNEEFQPEKVKTVSLPCMAMCQWVRAMYKWFFVNREIQPLRERLAAAEAELAVVTEALHTTQATLDRVVASVAALEREYNEAVDTQAALEAEVEATSRKLNRAGRLIDGLGGEKTRWVRLVEKYEEQERYVVGDMVVAAATVAYCGPLTAPYRQELRQRWKAQLSSAGVETSTEFDLVSTSGDAVKIQEWQLCGLPTDGLSTENAIILANSRNWPLLIDPQGQANTWVRNIHKNDNLQICKASNDKFMKTVENAIRLGLPCLVENVGESLDAALEPVLLQNIFMIGSMPHVRIGDSAIPYDNNFKLYLTTKLPNPTYTPETIVTVSLLNFFITPSGLEEQLLGKTVEKERNDLEQEKQRLTRSNAEKNRELKNLQENILVLLEEAEGDILEQEELIITLEKSKAKSTEINEELGKAKETERVIDETRNRYRPHAERGSLLFFCASQLAIVDPMYQFSLQWFMNLFLNTVDNAEQPVAAEDGEGDVTSDGRNLVEVRVQNLMDYFTYSFYSNVCRSLFEKHKLTFSFYLCTSLVQHRGEMVESEYRYLLTGPTGSVPANAMANPAPSWLTDSSWAEILFLHAHLPTFAGFADHVQANIEHYRALFDSNEADTYPLAAEWAEKATPLQRLVIVRCFRMDKVAPAIQHYVEHFMGERYIIVPQFDLMDAYKDSDCLTPLIFINSAGSDPMNDLLRFAETMRMSKRLDKVSLGQGQGKKAEELISSGRERGQWILLQNCHLASSWMPTLESIVESFTVETVKKEFRLWLTSMPSSSFPVSVLQIAVKMTNEPPMGLRANVTRSYYGFTAQDLEEEAKPVEFKKFVFALCLFHGVIQERRKFGSLGFNIAYEFNDSDRNVCLLQLRKFLPMYDTIPYDVLKFLTGEINYGGRVTDDWDRRCLMTLIQHFINPGVLENGYAFSPSTLYHTIVPGNRKQYLDYLDSWPLNPQPEVFGLHENADITCAQNTTHSILSTVLSLESRGGAGASASSREHLLTETAAEIASKLPPPFDTAAFSTKYPTKYEESMNTVLVQEAGRYNRLLRFIHTNLSEFMKAVRGEVVMSAELEAVGESFFVNSVPASWSALAYPSLKPLSNWLDDLVRRTRFIVDWYEQGPPAAFWFGGFFFPQAFLTGTLQNYARQVHEAIDRISFEFQLQSPSVQPATAPRPEKGALVYGMYMEGARWDAEQHSLAESRPKELYVEMPMMLLDPVVNRTRNPRDYVCPVYKTLTRAGTLSTTGHSTNFVLPVEIPTTVAPSHWIERGVACIVSLNY
ncbi:putative dynein heavy chain [Leptomonas pyrrhocoris]|uniref:Putative dynein heavy chain n=1 Tax=Leptomonas pyrrhocoris TaxID=157538 RepID=A0A0M9G9H3_LEPPY|nr:putative dynein heavy chain [Leptomonas pyrrhocoris]KPA85487.1 putative dynein heavy chain [Leptomonas pyrrhocoris]|eukprot:XP_015663926.1 putative dynein heavy chain [Leptomonas pyrrhocoris]